MRPDMIFMQGLMEFFQPRRNVPPSRRKVGSLQVFCLALALALVLELAHLGVMAFVKTLFWLWTVSSRFMKI
jgi:hypothetical protein